MAKRYLTPADVGELQSRDESQANVLSLSEDNTVYSITSVPEPLSVDMGKRMKTYAIQMLLRMGCFCGFVFLDNLWLRIACAVGVVLLPWSAVLLANVGADKSHVPSQYLNNSEELVNPRALPPSGGAVVEGYWS